MWTEDTVPNAVGAKVYPRYLGIAERLWGGIVDARHPRALDEDLLTAAKAHCSPQGLLSTDLGFACGRFEPMESIRSPVFKNATISSSMEAFSPAFSEDRAIDTSDESYFWAVAPKAGDYMDVTFRAEDSQHHGLVKGNDASFSAKWLRRLTIKTGSKDRPGDQLLKGMTKVMQWSQDPATGKRERSWVALCSFDRGICDAPHNVLANGPISSIRILVLQDQEKWMTMPAVLAEEMTGPEIWMPKSREARTVTRGQSHQGKPEPSASGALGDPQNASRSSEKRRTYRRTNGTKRQPHQVPLRTKPPVNMSAALRQLGCFGPSAGTAAKHRLGAEMTAEDVALQQLGRRPSGLAGVQVVRWRLKFRCHAPLRRSVKKLGKTQPALVLQELGNLDVFFCCAGGTSQPTAFQKGCFRCLVSFLFDTCSAALGV